MARANQAGGFLRSRPDQLADYLRGCIVRGDLAEPLPNIRDWSARLGVGHVTLQKALRILENENLVSVRPRQGVRLAAPSQAKAATAGERIVRWIYMGSYYTDSSIWSELFMAISERLREHGIQLVSERCDLRRLRAIQQRGELPNEMLLLISLGGKEQRLFANFQRSALLVGLPQKGIRLSYVWNDVEAAILHAARELASRGFQRLYLAMQEHRHVRPTESFFLRLCGELNPPAEGRLLRVPIDLTRQRTVAERFASQVRGRAGVLALYPVPISVLATALLREAIDMPGQVEVVAINTMLHTVRVVPAPTYYPYPVEAFARVIARSALQYFERGAVPRLQKRIPLEVVRHS